MARLSTHVLDTSRGTPAQNLVIDLHTLLDGERRRIQTVATNSEGRALFPGEPLERGVYELTFHAGDYFRGAGVKLADPPFLDHVVIQFGLADSARDYHVPLLLSPYGYSTYRGS
jgi:5-hydroxyisourate hydrolase